MVSQIQILNGKRLPPQARAIRNGVKTQESPEDAAAIARDHCGMTHVAHVILGSATRQAGAQCRAAETNLASLGRFAELIHDVSVKAAPEPAQT